MPISSCAGSSAGPTVRCCRPPIPAATVERLIAEREPVYQYADITVWSRDVPHEKIVDECVDALHARLCGEARRREIRRYVDATR